MKKYAFIVENEIFDILTMPEDEMFSEINNRWTTGFANSPVGIDITYFPDAYVNSVWLGSGFDNSEVNPNYDPSIDAGRKKFAFMSNNKIFAVVLPAGGKEKEDMYTAAFESNVTGMDISDLDPAISRGWVWDGNSFNPPGE